MLIRNSLAKFASALVSSGPHKVEATPRRVRTLFNKIYVADTTSAKHVWEHPYFPQYYLPTDAVHSNKHAQLQKGSAVDDDGSAFLATLKVGQRATDRVVMFEKGALAGLVRLEFGAMGIQSLSFSLSGLPPYCPRHVMNPQR